MNDMNGVLPSPQELMRFCQSRSETKKRFKLSKLRDRSESGVKQESNDDFKDYAETTMNELLGWYGYEKLDTRETKNLNLKHFSAKNKRMESQKQMSANMGLSSATTSTKSKDIIINREESCSALSPYSLSDGGGGGGVGTTADSTGVCRSASPPMTTTTESNGENGIENKDCSEDNQNIPPDHIVCAWCAKVGMKLFTLRTATGSKAFCSELCFTQCRRASFKKNKICDWCKHVRHTVNYVDYQEGEQQLQFCSNKCLNQYKMNIFCNETKALAKESLKSGSSSKTSNLITPDLWLKDFKNNDNENNSFNDSSDSDTDPEFDASPLIVGQPHKRKFNEFSRDQLDYKSSGKHKEKTNKELKRIKLSNKLSNSSSSSRLTPGAKHSKHSNPDFGQNNRLSLRENKEKTSSSFHSFRPHRHSPIPPNVPSMTTPMAAPNHNIPIINGNPVVNPNIRPNPHMAHNGSPSGHLFPRLSANLGRGGEHPIHAPIMPSPPFPPRGPPMPNLLGAAQMEMLLRMQSGFAGLRHPLPPYPPHPPTGYPFPGLPHMNGIHPTNGSPLLQPSHHTSGSVPTHLSPNLSLLPPITVMTPYPVPIPIPIPIPVPILFPVSNESLLKYSNENYCKSNKQMNANSTNEVTTTSYNNGLHNGSALINGTNASSALTSSKVESVISKLVERKTKANGNQNNSGSGPEDSLDLRQRIDENSSNDNEWASDESRDSLPQNLVVSREKRSVGRSVASLSLIP